MQILNNQWSSSLNKRTEDTFLQGQPLTEVKISTYELCAILLSSVYFTFQLFPFFSQIFVNILLQVEATSLLMCHWCLYSAVILLWKKWTTNMLQKMEHPASSAFLSLALFWPTRGRLCKNQIRSLLGMHWMLPGYSFQPRPNIRAHALDTAVSVMTSGLSINGCSHTENQFDERKQDN